MHREHATALYFSRAAAYYQTHAALHREIAQQLMQRLPAAGPRRIMDLGCGTGFLTALLAERYPAAALDALDFAPGMLAVAKTCLPACRKIAWRLADIFDFAPAGAYDLIASSSTIQWMAPFDRLFARLAGMLAKGGMFAAAVFVDGTFKELYQSRQAAAPHNPLTGRMPAIAELERALCANGFDLSASQQQTKTQSFASAGEFLSTIKRLGFTGGHLSAAVKPLSPGELAGLRTYYQTHFGRSDGSVEASFEVVYLLARGKGRAADD